MQAIQTKPGTAAEFAAAIEDYLKNERNCLTEAIAAAKTQFGVVVSALTVDEVLKKLKDTYIGTGLPNTGWLSHITMSDTELLYELRGRLTAMDRSPSTRQGQLAGIAALAVVLLVKNGMDK